MARFFIHDAEGRPDMNEYIPELSRVVSVNLLRDDYPNVLYAFNYKLISTLHKETGLRITEIKRGLLAPKVISQALAKAREAYQVPTFHKYIFQNKAGWTVAEQAVREASALQEIAARPETIEKLNAYVRALNESNDLEKIDEAYTEALRLCKPGSNHYLLITKNVGGEIPELCSFREGAPAKPGTLRKPAWPVFERKP